jgi:hypothetical protein
MDLGVRFHRGVSANERWELSPAQAELGRGTLGGRGSGERWVLAECMGPSRHVLLFEEDSPLRMTTWGIRGGDAGELAAG